MAFVPAPDFGDDLLENEAASGGNSIPSFYLDRLAVTNEDFARFVDADGYGEMDFWPQSVWPSLLQFVDTTGHAGPRFWRQGRPMAGRERHPVVGINWFEARAYTKWCGKRLPTSLRVGTRCQLGRRC